MFIVADLVSLKITCTDSTEAFSKLSRLRSAGLEPSLAETKLAVQGYL